MVTFLKVSIPVLFLTVFLIPGYAFFKANPDFFKLLLTTSPSDPVVYLTTFKLFGLYAFTLVWAQLMVGPFTGPLARIYGTARVLKWHRTQGLLAFLLATLHPILFHIGMYLSTHNPFGFFSDLETYLNSPTFVLVAHFGPYAWIMMTLAVMVAIFRGHPLLWRHWRKIHMLNYVVFILVFVHSFSIGSDTQLQPLKSLYIFFALTFAISVTYRIGYRRLWPYIFIPSAVRDRSK